ncbi:hypothetical protein HAZT_HAZT010193 [Hyalella azteca]|uniref:BPTI/Kunitz inhibitor domain-containing protein n=2 Tax=Hyalella azteca TaxID=294128 RepID=A0A6A0GVN0_HYAAZ|nr:hypothetical protein HAZT_HAZT010193 [Hyalella azteca]
MLLAVLSAATAQNQVCFLQAETGTCRAFLPSYYYNTQTGSCDCFVFGGCRPGGNNFNTIEDCMRVCNVNPATQIWSETCQRIFARNTTPSPIQPVQPQPTQPPTVQPQPIQPQTQPIEPQVLQPQQPTESHQGQKPVDQQQVQQVDKQNLTPNQIQQLQSIFEQLSTQQNVQKPPTTAQPSPIPPAVLPQPIRTVVRPRPDESREDDDNVRVFKPVFPPPLPVFPPPLPGVVRPPVPQQQRQQFSAQEAPQEQRTVASGTVFGSVTQGGLPIAVGQPVRITG